MVVGSHGRRALLYPNLGRDEGMGWSVDPILFMHFFLGAYGGVEQQGILLYKDYPMYHNQSQYDWDVDGPDLYHQSREGLDTTAWFFILYLFLELLLHGVVTCTPNEGRSLAKPKTKNILQNPHRTRTNVPPTTNP